MIDEVLVTENERAIRFCRPFFFALHSALVLAPLPSLNTCHVLASFRLGTTTNAAFMSVE